MIDEEKAMEPQFGEVNIERRNHSRAPIVLPVEYWPLNNSKSRPGRTGDISEGGVLLYLPEEIESGQNLRVKIFMGTGLELKPIEAFVQVVWKDLHSGNRNYYRIGVRFVDISAENMEKLKKFLNDAMTDIKPPSEINIPSRLLSALGISLKEKQEVPSVLIRDTTKTT